MLPNTALTGRLAVRTQRNSRLSWRLTRLMTHGVRAFTKSTTLTRRSPRRHDTNRLGHGTQSCEPGGGSFDDRCLNGRLAPAPRTALYRSVVRAKQRLA